MNIIQVRDCPECEKYLIEHPSLNTARRLTMQRRGKTGNYYHFTKNGKLLHKLASQD